MAQCPLPLLGRMHSWLTGLPSKQGWGTARRPPPPPPAPSTGRRNTHSRRLRCAAAAGSTAPSAICPTSRQPPPLDPFPLRDEDDESVPLVMKGRTRRSADPRGTARRRTRMEGWLPGETMPATRVRIGGRRRAWRRGGEWIGVGEGAREMPACAVGEGEMIGVGEAPGRCQRVPSGKGK
uniref:Uncharacterized protein n=1 Tax=Arundo donax TaxID=35708 RepID=A0A0A9D850_ARUDO